MEEVYYWECAVPLEYGERGVGGRKPTRPSLPLRKAPPFSPSLSSIVFTTPSVPLLGDRNPQGREDVTALRCSEPLRSKVGGASKPSPCCAGWDRLGTIVNSLQFIFGGFDDKLQIYCGFLGVLEYGYWHSPINGLC